MIAARSSSGKGGVISRCLFMILKYDAGTAISSCVRVRPKLT